MTLGNVAILEQLRRENYEVLIVILSVFKVVHAGEGVRGVRGAREVLEGEPKVLENLDPSGLTTGEFLRGFPVLKVFVVSTYLYLVHGSFEMVTPFFESADNGQEFAVVNIIVSFSRIETFGVESAGVPLSIFWSLD